MKCAIKQIVYIEGIETMLLDRLGKEILFFDGGMGSLLQKEGLLPGELPELWNFKQSDIVKKFHQSYFDA